MQQPVARPRGVCKEVIMFRWIIGSSLQFRFLILAAAAALVVFGAMQLQKMSVDVFPEFAPPVVEVQTEANGLSAEEVESLISLNLEELLSGVPWLESIRSESVTGLSSIKLNFARGTDVMKARQMIQERLTLAYTLPNVSTPPVILQPLSATSRFMMVAISSEQIDPTVLSLLARWTIKPRLVGVPGVANVAIWGQRLRQMHVQIDPNRLRDARMLQEEIIAAAGDALWVSPLTFLKGSAPGTSGWIDNRNQRLSVQHNMPIESPEDMAKVAVASPYMLMTGKTMALGEIAEVTFAHPPLIGDAVTNSPGNGLMLVIEKFPSANTLEVTRGVDQALAELSRGLPGVDINTQVFRLASYVGASISNLAAAIVIGAVLVVLTIGAFLFDWRSALISGVSIVVSLLAAVAVLQLAGTTINTMILAGLLVALSVIIGDVVVDTDLLRERLRNRAPGAAPAIAIIYETTLETRSAAIYATLIVVLAVLPVFFMGGVAGAFFEPLGWAYLLAALASLVVALTVTPALSLTLLGQPARVDEPPLVRWLGAKYQPFMRRTLQLPRRVFVGAAVLLLAGAVVAPLLGHSLLPPLQERDMLVNWSTPPGTSHAETQRITTRVSNELRALPGIRNVGAHVGRAVTGDQVVGINSSQIWISIDPAANYDRTVAAIRETIDGYPGIDRSVQHYLRDKVGEVLTGEGRPIVVRIYGQQRDVLQRQAAEVRKALAPIAGLADLRIEGQVEEPQVQVKVNLEAAGRASVKPGDVRRAASTVFSGLVVGYLFKEQKINEVVVWSAPEARQSLTSLRDLWIEKSDRSYVRLGDVADISIVSTPTVIRHERIAPYVDVVANVVGRDPAAVADEVDDRLEKVSFPLEYHPELLGEYAERQKAQERILGVSLVAMIGIFLLLQACLRSWLLALLAFLSLPASMIGGVLAALAGGGTVSVGSIVGFLAVLGIAVRNSVLLIGAYRRLESEAGARCDLDLVLRGTREQLLPIVASSAAMVAALLPIVVMGRIPGLEIIFPMAIVIIGGIVASTLFSLLVLPPLYLLIGPRVGRQLELDLSDGHGALQ
jgi:CzcA family heavy metal efflux pump